MIRVAETGSNGVFQRDGYACLFDDEAERLKYIDREIRSAMRIEAREWQVSSLIDERDLERCGFITGFPTQLTAAVPVAPAAYEEISKRGEIRSGDLSHCGKHLTPAACLNLYPMIAAYAPLENMTVTTRATVFRHEEYGFCGLARLWEFQVREFVFVGSATSVNAKLEAAILSSIAVARKLGLSPVIREASDHFYDSRANRIREQLQKGGKMKRELCIEYDGGELAIASFNYHATHFSGSFGFDNSGSVVTGCVGFGLHRWLASTIKSKHYRTS